MQSWLHRCNVLKVFKAIQSSIYLGCLGRSSLGLIHATCAALAESAVTEQYLFVELWLRFYGRQKRLRVGSQWTLHSQKVLRFIVSIYTSSCQFVILIKYCWPRGFIIFAQLILGIVRFCGASCVVLRLVVCSITRFVARGMIRKSF